MRILEHRTALITGTNRGIGHAIAEKMAYEGANIYAHARKENPEFEEWLKELSLKYHIGTFPVYFELTDTEQMKEVMKPILKSTSSMDILVNNAGVSHGGLFSMTNIRSIREVFDINLFAAMELTQLVLRKMMRQKKGCIINMASVAAFNVRAGNSAYGVSKAAVKAWTETLAVETASSGVRVNAIAPGLTDTDMAKKIKEKSGREMLIASAMKRFAAPEEIANTAVFLASDAASFINGHTLIVNGGGCGD